MSGLFLRKRLAAKISPERGTRPASNNYASRWALQPYFLLILLIIAFLAGGCTIASQPDGRTEPTYPSQPPGEATDLRGVPYPWGPLAGRLVADGLDPTRVKNFFNSPGLSFKPKPMETKLRELFGIFYRSDLTKSVQEHLFQLGYDITIDGRNGSGTKRVIQAFQKDHGLSQTGAVTPELLSRLEGALKTGRVRTLAEYKPPQAVQPSRSTTHKRFTDPAAISQIRSYYLGDKAIFDRMERAYGVPGPLVASIMWIETSYGGYLGVNKAAEVLASMAASADFNLISTYVSDLDSDREARSFLVETAAKRGNWAKEELEALLRYAWENDLAPMSFPGSIYGAIGYGQFMPSNIKKYAVDGDGDGRIDLFNKTDAIFSIGNYLRENGWSGNMSSEDKRREVIRRYNNSGVYINTVLYVMEAIG
ncbi:MAG: lytic murein transglycosylase [Deltaproteobacteria bacterium]|jgi:membrane-bound lytic murein transglycosylase B|nr:lytic murein transglycosylase [Deltaproteobacteria bacterium]